ncbi:MAG TPA: hypothetical protein VFY29_02070 [Terriglobia bacterium]|nr:hypothetical protein [Terriglobia bacterium]
MTTNNRKVLVGLLVTVACVFAMSGTAEAQSRGIRVGISANPEQVYFGAHADVAEVVQELWFRPNFEAGFGDGLTLITLNGEFVYHFPLSNTEWRPYVGAGPAAVIGTFSNSSGRHSHFGPGFNFLFGIEKPKGLLAEIKVGAIDSADFKFGIGWTW